MASPLGFQEELNAIERRRQLATALRLKMMQGRDPDRVVDGVLLPNFSGISNARMADEAALELAALDEQQRALIGDYQGRYKSAVGDLMAVSADPWGDVPDAEGKLANAQMFGLNTADILKQRQQAALMRRFGITPESLFSDGGGGAPQAAGVFNAEGATGLDQGGGGGGHSLGGGTFRTGFEPQPQRAASATSGIGGPLANANDGKLVAIAALDGDGTMGKLAKAALAAREIKIHPGPEGTVILTVGGREASPNHPIYAQVQEEALKYLREKGKISATVAGETTRAQETAKLDLAPRTTATEVDRAERIARAQKGVEAPYLPPVKIERPDGSGISDVYPAEVYAEQQRRRQAPPAPGPMPNPQAPIGGAGSPNGRLNMNFQNAKPEEVEAALQDFQAQQPPAPPSNFDARDLALQGMPNGGRPPMPGVPAAAPLPPGAVGRTQSPAERVAAEEGAKTEAERQRVAIPKLDAPTGQYLTGNPNQAPGTAMKPSGYVPAAKPAPENYTKQVAGIANTVTAIEEYLKVLDRWGGMDSVRPDARALMTSKYNNLALNAKEAYNLGVLNGGDWGVITGVVTDPTSLKGMVTSDAALKKQANELRRILERNKKNLDRVYRQGPEVLDAIVQENQATPGVVDWSDLKKGR